MTDHPIIFSGPMVKALLEGRKTMTRRLAWRPYKRLPKILHPLARLIDNVMHGPSAWQRAKPGDRLWVKETWLAAADGCWSVPDVMRARGTVKMDMRYRADGVEGPWYPSIHMPRWASRLTLAVTAVKVEPLQKISLDDIVAEGAKGPFSQDTAAIPGPAARMAWEENAEMAWESLWIALHGQDSWDANPEVVALTFTVHQQNIDQLKAAA